MEYLGRFGIDTKKNEPTATFMRPPWKEMDEVCIDLILTGIPKESGTERFRREAVKIIQEKYERHEKIYTDGSKKDERAGYAGITPNPYLQKESTPTKHHLQHRTRDNH
jgi:hypothetical protein